MKLKAQMVEQRRVAHKLMKKAQESNDIKAEGYYEAIIEAMDWVMGSRNEDYYLDESGFPIGNKR